MTWLDAIALARRSVARRLGRAVLTVLAVALGTALLSSLLIASQAAKHRVLDQVSAGGPLAGIRVDAALPDPNALDSDNPRKGAPRAIDDRAIDTIRHVANVQSIVPVLVSPALVVPPAGSTRRSGPFFDAMVGVDLARINDLPVNVVAGRLPESTETGEVAVTLGYLHRLGLHDADAQQVVGSEIQLGSPRAFGAGSDARPRGRWTRVEIVGVVSQEAGSGQVLVPFTMARDARAWTLLGGSVNGFGTSDSPYTTLFVVAHGLSHVADVRAAINALGYSTAAPETLITSVQRYVHIVEIVLAGIGVIGLAIAALGITNAMLAAVRERRREIGVLKAVGAADRDVRRVFLVEAAALGLLGGVVGATVGLTAARLLAAVVNGYLASQQLESVQLGVPIGLLFVVIGGATLLALAAGALPAQRAARLPARQAMGDR
jgi:ABC-type antimicrobial peptide transport system permease subunit